jgi:putative chitinase
MFMPYMITEHHLATIAGKPTSLMPALADWINKICPAYEIDMPHEYAHFLAQACHETDRFRTLEEYASGNAYEGRKDLGNKYKGDGSRYKGRGIFQTTGRANYLQLGVKRGNDNLFIDSPELLEQPEYAVWSACEFWVARHLNDAANEPDSAILKKKYRGKVHDVSPVEFISISINGGLNGIDERKQFYAIAKSVLV